MAYIDREKAFEIITDFAGTATTKSAYSAFWKSAKALNKLPTADVVEVVRCKYCVHYCGFEHCKNGICDREPYNKRAVYPTDYCSYGEMRGGVE